MNIILSLTSCILDIYILKRFLQSVNKEITDTVRSILFSIVLILSEGCLMLNMHLFQNVSSVISSLLTSCLSILLTFFACLFFESSFRKKLFDSLIFEILVMISEQTCILLYKHFPAFFFTSEEAENYMFVMNILSKLFLLIYVTLFTLFYSKKIKTTITEYNLLIFITPLFSCTLIIMIPKDINIISENEYFFEFLVLFISILNILNNYLLYKIGESYKNKIENIELTNQINYQKDRYIQLSESYKISRRIIHDIKKHYFEIQQNLRLKKYDNLDNYLDSSIYDLEKTYSKYNTGNLVIDSLLTYYENITERKKILFTTIMDVDNNRIPVDDYSLCIILGNLIDNSINACDKIKINDEKSINVKIITNKKDKFLVEIDNSFLPSDKPVKENRLNHGYGLDNVKSKIEEYNGIMTTVKDDKYRVFISIPITEIRKRITPPF